MVFIPLRFLLRNTFPREKELLMVFAAAGAVCNSEDITYAVEKTAYTIRAASFSSLQADELGEKRLRNVLSF